MIPKVVLGVCLAALMVLTGVSTYLYIGTLEGNVYRPVGGTIDSEPRGARAAGLTDREIAILTALSRGLSNDEIAAQFTCNSNSMHAPCEIWWSMWSLRLAPATSARSSGRFGKFAS